MTSPLPVMQYLVAFNNNPLDSPTAITSVATVGTVGAVNAWTDITAYVSQHQMARGRQHELKAFEAGTLNLQLNNADGRFYPGNTSGPYFGLLMPRKWVQVRATIGGTTYYRFTGHATSWAVLWDDPLSEFATLDASDPLRLLNMTNLTNCGYEAAVIADGASAYYRLGELNGTAAVDSSGNGSTGTYTSGVVQGVAGALLNEANGAAQFGVISRVAVPINAHTAPTLASTVAYSVEAWVQVPPSSVSSLITTFNMPIYAWAMPVPDVAGLVLNGGSGIIQVMDWDNSGTVTGSVNMLPNDGLWHHIGISHAASGSSSIYIDGALDSTFSAGAYSAATPTGVSVGGWPAGTSGVEPPYSVDEAAFYAGVALTAAQWANHYQRGKTGFPQESSGVQIGDLLNSVGWPAAARNIDTGSSTMQASAPTGSVLSGIQAIETSEFGILYADAHGLVRFISRYNLLLAPYATSQATFGDNPGELPFNPGVALAIDDLDLYNDATATRVGGMTQEVTNATSVAAFGVSSYPSETGLLTTTDAEVLIRAQWIVNHYAVPMQRLASVVINLTDDLVNLPPAVLGRELMDRVTVNRHHVAGSTFSQVGLIEAISEMVTPDGWQVTLSLSPADVQPYWVLGDAVAGVLGTTTRLAY